MKRLLVALALLLLAAPAAAQSNATLKRAMAASDTLDYPTALRLARLAIGERLTATDLRVAYRLLGTTYAAMDSSSQAQDAFSQLILLDPEFDFNAAQVSPKITAQYAIAMAQVLVVRHLAPDSATVSFVAGRSQMTLRFTLTQHARVVTRIVGPTGSATLDSSVADPGTIRVVWNGLLAGGAAPVAGRYRMTVEAASTGNQFSAELPLNVAVAAVDTQPHLLHLEGYDTLPEMVVPSRSFRPLGTAALVTGLIAGSALALENGDIGGTSRRQVTIGAGAAMLIGLVASFGQPVPQPAEANIRYNRLIRDQLARQNQQIAQSNRLRQQEVQLTVTATTAAP